ncbi:hypothetical protein LK09_14565 [Microbacterium mangrovi]|uniref:Uncharacterized protein n=1 Tax=Microbacterium mangrovi TaxID=1348253 RepID=A0A0B1ZZI9_9MICO|nr:hypothetical protein LK09_14565 [Microbacterium mangrovi]
MLILVVVIAVIWLLIARPWSGSATAASTSTTSPAAAAAVQTSPTPTPTPTVMSPSPSPTASGSPSPSPSPSSTAVASACDASSVTVVPLTDHTVYAAGQNPKLSIKLTNTSAVACKINVGTATQSFTITSGTDTWWRSTDCQKDPSDMVVLLKAGQTVTSSTPVVWDRTRSSVNSCVSKSRPVAPSGGATYHLTVSIGGFDALTDTVFQLG